MAFTSAPVRACLRASICYAVTRSRARQFRGRQDGSRQLAHHRALSRRPPRGYVNDQLPVGDQHPIPRVGERAMLSPYLVLKNKRWLVGRRRRCLRVPIFRLAWVTYENGKSKCARLRRKEEEGACSVCKGGRRDFDTCLNVARYWWRDEARGCGSARRCMNLLKMSSWYVLTHRTRPPHVLFRQRPFGHLLLHRSASFLNAGWGRAIGSWWLLSGFAVFSVSLSAYSNACKDLFSSGFPGYFFKQAKKSDIENK
jgi:hypothetical protein